MSWTGILIATVLARNFRAIALWWHANPLCQWDPSNKLARVLRKTLWLTLLWFPNVVATKFDKSLSWALNENYWSDQSKTISWQNLGTKSTAIMYSKHKSEHLIKAMSHRLLQLKYLKAEVWSSMCAKVANFHNVKGQKAFLLARLSLLCTYNFLPEQYRNLNL